MDNRTFEEIKENLEALVAHDSPLGKSLWQEFVKLHPADIAQFFQDIDRDNFEVLFKRLPEELRMEVFEELSDPMKVFSLSFMTDAQRETALNTLSSDELTDLFDMCSDEELKEYLNLLHKKSRQRVLSLLKFHPESAGGIMDIEVLTILEDFTIEKSIKLLQRLQPQRDIYQQLYVTDDNQRLVGYINLEDLILNPPKTKIKDIMKPNELVALANEDQETIAEKMVHYGLMTVPVVGDDNHFLGVIPGETLVDVIVEEASENVQKMSALAPMKQPYFHMPFFRVLWERSYILIALLFAESFVTAIQQAHASTLRYGMLAFFTTTLVSVGGNASNQTSALVIQGLASGDVRPSNIWRFLKRELAMAFMLALLIGIFGFGRAYFATRSVIESIIVGTTLGSIVLMSVSLGSLIPLLLKRLNIDPAFSAGPFLATAMDILGVLLYCYISMFILAL